MYVMNDDRILLENLTNSSSGLEKSDIRRDAETCQIGLLAVIGPLNFLMRNMMTATAALSIRFDQAFFCTHSRSYFTKVLASSMSFRMTVVRATF